MSTVPVSSALGAALCSLGFAIGAGGPLRVVAVLGGVAFLACAVIVSQPRVVVMVVTVWLLVPLPESLDFRIAVSGGTVFLTDALVLALAAASLMLARPLRLVPTMLAGSVATIGLLGALASGNELQLALRELRGPAYLTLGVMIGLGAARSELLRSALWHALVAALWIAALFVLVSSLTGVTLVQGGEVQTFVSGEPETFNATRFQLGITHVALMTLAGLLSYVLIRPWGRGSRRMLIVLGVPSSLLVFVSFSRNSLIAVAFALGFTAIASFRWRQAARFAARFAVGGMVAVVVFVIVLLGSDVVSRGLGLEDNPIRTQVSAYQGRVLGLLEGENLERDSSAQFRRIENEHALDAIRARPVLGHGFGAEYRPPLPEFGEFGTTTGLAYVHDYYLWVAVKTGFAGLALTLVLFGAPFVRWLATRRVAAETMAVVPLLACLAGVLGVLIVAPIAGSLPGSVAIGILIGLLWEATAGEQPTIIGRASVADREAVPAGREGTR